MKTMICVDTLGYSQSNYELFSSINETVENSLEEISVAPVDVTNKLLDIKTAITNISETDSFLDGVLIASTIENAERILGCVTNSIKILYLYDLDWMFKVYLYDYLYDILTSPELKIIVRSESHIDPLDKLCGVKPIGVVEDFKLEKIWNLLSSTKTNS